MLTLSGLILALNAFLLGYAWARREPAEPTLYTAGRWHVVGADCAYELRCGETRIARFTSYHKAVAADRQGAA